MLKNLMINLQKFVNDRETCKNILQTKKSELEKHLKHLKNLEEARSIFQTASQVTQTKLAEKIETIVSSALASVFDDPYTFEIEFVSKRNVIECELSLKRNDKTYSPLNSCGLGVADIASLALRVAYWNLDGKSRNTCILDEPLRALSIDKQERASMMIHELSKIGNGLQFIIVTHSTLLSSYADKCFRVKKENNISYVMES